MDKPKDKRFANQRAVALKYDPSDAAPKVVAKGSGLAAERIIEKGMEADIPLYKDPKLLEELTGLSLGENIPPELYEVVAQVLIFISDLDRLEAIRQYGK